jgi:hypothetical protein
VIINIQDPTKEEKVSAGSTELKEQVQGRLFNRFHCAEGPTYSRSRKTDPQGLTDLVASTSVSPTHFAEKMLFLEEDEKMAASVSK